jgi:hypothetical protein
MQRFLLQSEQSVSRLPRPSRPLIYLCGPIGGQLTRDAVTWREEAAELLAPDFGVLDPLRDLTPEARRSQADSVITARETADTFTAAELVERDLLDIRRSYLVLRHYLGPSEGSPMECVYARLFGVPVVVSGIKHWRDASPWLRYHSVRIVPTVPEAVAYIKSYWHTMASIG